MDLVLLNLLRHIWLIVLGCPASFLKGNGGQVDLGEKGSGGEAQGGEEGGEAAVKIHDMRGEITN